MYHTRPIKTYDMITALIDRVADSISDPEPTYDDVLSNASADARKDLLAALIKFNDAFLESRDG